MKEWIAGRNPVMECLRASRRHFFQLLLAEGTQYDAKVEAIIQQADAKHLKAEHASRFELDQLHPNNQGIALQVSGYPYVDLEDIFQYAQDKTEPLLLLLLDQIQDPQNFGALVRSAEVFGAHGILIPTNRVAGVTPTVVSVSSGASEHMRIAQGNLSQAIDHIREQNAWVVGLDMNPNSISLDQANLSGRLAIVVGGEGSGLRRLVCERCDQIVRIPMCGKLDSLNAAVAGSIALYVASSRR